MRLLHGDIMLLTLWQNHMYRPADRPLHLKEQAAVGLQADALAIGQREQAVVVHDAVQVLHPHRVHVAIKHQVARLILL